MVGGTSRTASSTAISIAPATVRLPSPARRRSIATPSPETKPPIVAVCLFYTRRVDLDAFVHQPAGTWRRLELLADRRNLSPDEADELVGLYQLTSTHLSLIQSRTPDPATTAQLS